MEHARDCRMCPRIAPFMIQVMIIVALAFGALAGWVDVTNSDVQPAVACLFLSSLVLAVITPKLAGLWALIIGLSIPAAHAIVRIFHLSLPYPVDAYASTFLALIPAALGALLGFAARWLIANLRSIKPANS